MRFILISILFLSISDLHSQYFLDATISFNGSDNLVITINSDASFQFNQDHSGAVSLIIDEVYDADAGNFTSSVDGGSGISYISTIGNTGSANQIGAFGFDFGVYTIRDEELTFPNPPASFSSGDILTIQAGTVISFGSFPSHPGINPGPYTAFIASDDYLSIAAPQVMTLPVELIRFSGTEKDNKIHLSWVTA